MGVTASESGYAHDGNGNLTLAGPVLQAQYNIMNLPTSIRTEAGKRHFAYVYGGGKYEARIEADTVLSETRHYFGGIEFVDGNPESYNFGDGRIVYSDSVPPRPQFRLTDHLGNTVVFFEDKNLDGCITTEADTSGLAVEVLQRLWYYPFGLQMENLSTWETEPGQGYRYNGKERDTLSGWYEYGARWGILEIGRWNGVDPLADNYPGWSPFSFTLDNPISFTDPTGMGVDWHEDGNGNLVKDAGDNAQTLQTYIQKQTGVEISSEHAESVNASVGEGGTVSTSLAVNAALLLVMPSNDNNRLIGHIALQLGNTAYSFEGDGKLYDRDPEKYINWDGKKFGMMEAPITAKVSLADVKATFNNFESNVNKAVGYNLITSSCITSCLNGLNTLGIATNNTRGQVVLPISIMYEAYNKGIVGNAIYHNPAMVQNSINNVVPTIWNNTQWGTQYRGKIFK